MIFKYLKKCQEFTSMILIVAVYYQIIMRNGILGFVLSDTIYIWMALNNESKRTFYRLGFLTISSKQLLLCGSKSKLKWHS